MKTLALTFTIHFDTWQTPALITMGGFIAFAVVCWRESKNAGDYSMPIMSFMAFCAWLAATASAWIVYFLS